LCFLRRHICLPFNCVGPVISVLWESYHSLAGLYATGFPILDRKK
jgi:hypothetical protein